MYNEVILAILSFTIIMMGMNVVKDYLIQRYMTEVTDDHLRKVNKRFIISYILGVVILYLLYGNWNIW